jgi:hypothetical protein
MKEKKTMGKLVKHETVLTYSAVGTNRYRQFSNIDDDTDLLRDVYQMPVDIYEDFGKPSTITITIKSGDELN